MKADLQRLALIVREAEQRFEQAKQVTAKVKRDVAEGERIEREALENIRLLKSDKVVVVATEYKEALKNLNHLRHSLIRIRSFQIDRDKDLVTCEQFMIRAKEDFRKAEDSESRTVLQGNFGRKNGQG